METKVKEFFTKKRTCALITVLILILDMFSPYSILIHTVNAASPIDENKPYFELAIHPIDASGDYDSWDEDTGYYYYDYDPETDTPETYTGTKIVTMDIIIKNGTTLPGLNAGNIKLKYDNSIFEPIAEVNIGTNKKPNWVLQTPDTMEDWAVDGIYFDPSPATGIDTSACTFRIDGATTETMADETVIATLRFQLKAGKKMEDITKNVFTIADVDDIMLAYNGGADYVNGPDYLLFNGFAAGAKKVDSISIVTMPSKTQYYKGETLDYTNGEVKISYDDSSNVTIPIADAIANGTLTASSTVATDSKKVTLTCDTKTVDFEYYVLDSLSVSSNLSKMNYEHGDTINFAGGELTATYKNASNATSTAKINIADEIKAKTLSVNKTKADFDNKTITFTYYNGKTADMTLTVTDPIQSISITTQPSKLTYNDGETISLAGGVITPITKSGKTAPTVATNAATVTASTTTASIAQATSKWAIAGRDGLEAGSQTVTLTYEGKTADFIITVNDTVSSVSITTQPTVKNKLGTTSHALDFTGLVATVQTSGGGSFTVGPNSLTIDRSSYNANSINMQSFPVKYGTVSSSNNAEITLTNYITGISVNFTKTEFDYETPLSTVLASGTYTENYANGTSSTPKAITAGMVTGYNNSPASALFASDHTYAETLTIKLSTSSNEFDMLPATTTQAIKIKDVVDNITVKNKPNTITYNYGETFSSNGGIININYKSGATATLSMGNEAVALTQDDGSIINMSPAVSEFVNGKATKTIKVTYTNDSKTFDTSFDITIRDEISSIAVTTDPTCTFEHGDTFNTNGGKLTITYASTRTDVIDLDDAQSVTEADGTEINMSPAASEYTNNSLTKTIKVTHGGKDTTYTITLNNTIKEITVEPPTTTTYNLNDPTSLAGGKVVVTRKALNTENVELTDSSVKVTNFETTTAGTKTANVKYTKDGKDYTGTFTYNVANNITGITITKPTKTTYNHGDSLDLTGGIITINYASGTPQTEPISSATITEADGNALDMSPAASKFGADNTLSKTLKISYTKDGKTGSANYPITIVNDVRTISVHSTNHKVKYNVNETLDTSKLEILVHRAVGTDEVVSMPNANISVTGFSSASANTSLPLTVSYTENGITKTTSYKVEVKDVVDSISISTKPTKTEYKYGEALSIAGGMLTVNKGSGTTTIPMTNNMVSGYNPNTLGEQTLTVTYGQDINGDPVTATYKVTVKDYVTKIKVNPANVTGKYNDELSKLINDNTITYTVTYAKAGDKTPVTLAESMVAGYSKTATSEQNLTVTYADNDADSYTKGQKFTDKLKITLQDEITTIDVTAPTSSQTYKYGKTLDLTGATITVNYLSGTTPKTVTATANMVVEKGTTNAVNMRPQESDFTANHTLTKDVTIQYTEGGKTGKANYTITIIDDIQSISIVNKPKTEYKIDDTLDITAGKIKVTRASGNTETIAMTDSRVEVTGFNSSVENTQLPLTVTFKENGVTKQDSYNISIKDEVTSVEIGTMPKQNYKYGESLDVSTGTLNIVRSSGPATLPITPNMVTEADGKPFDSTILGTRNLNITYGGITKTYEVTVSDYVLGIILTPPTKLTYEYGESLNLAGGSVQKVMASGNATTKVALTDSSVALSTFNSAKIGAQTINVTYEGKTESFGVIVEDNIQSIVMQNTPKIDYKYGEALDVTNGTIQAIRSSGAKEVINITNSMVTGFNPQNLGKQPLTVTYGDKTTSYEVEVQDYIIGIELIKPNKLIYKINDEIDLAGGKVIPVMASGNATTKVAMTNSNVTITGFNTTSEGAKLIKVTYKGFTKEFGITVVDELSAIAINTLPDKLDYKYGEELDLTGGTINVIKESGASKTINITNDMVSEYNPKKLGNQTITITYEGLTQEFIVNVKDYISKLQVKEPEKVEYEYGESLDLAGGSVSIIMASGKTDETVNMTASMVSGYDKTKEGKQTIKVEYKGLQGEFQVNVVDKVKGISINTEPNKISYKYGESLDVTGATITVIKSSGIKEVNVTKDMVSGYNANTPGTQIITVTYEGFTTKFIVIVAEKEEPKEPEVPVTPEKPEEPNTPTTPEEPQKPGVITTPTKPQKPATPNRPSNSTKPNTNTNTQLPQDNQDTPITDEEQPNTPMVDKENSVNKPEKTEEKPTQEPVQPAKKPTATLGVQDEKESNNLEKEKVFAGVLGAVGLLLFIILVFFKRNVKVYVEENGEFVLGGTDKITKKNAKLNIDPFLDGETYSNKVKVVLSDAISEKLDGKEIEIKHRGKTLKVKVKYNDEPYEFILE